LKFCLDSFESKYNGMSYSISGWYTSASGMVPRVLWTVCVSHVYMLQ
jgi:hypothetical protein